jgi:hypothetical protein
MFDKIDNTVDLTPEYVRNILDYQTLSANVLYTTEKNSKLLLHDLEKSIGIPSIQIKQIKKSIYKMDIIDPLQTYVELEDIQISAKGNSNEEILNNLMKKENYLFTTLLLKASNLVNRVNCLEDSDILTKNDLEILQYEVEKHRLLADKFIVSPLILDEIDSNFSKSDFDRVTKEDLLSTGIHGSIWGVNIYELGDVGLFPFRILFAVADGRYLGYRRIRSIDVSTCLSSKLKCVTLTENLCILNPTAIACSLEHNYITNSINYTEIKKVRKQIESMTSHN